MVKITLAPLVLLCGALAATLHGQTIYTWTGAADGSNLATPGNWNPVGLPDGNLSDTAQWDGAAAGNLVLSIGSPGLPIVNFDNPGIDLVLTKNQSQSVQIISPVSESPQVGVLAVSNNSPSSALILGDATMNNVALVACPSGAVHSFVNNSTADSVINPNVEWSDAGGTGYTFDFSGTGNWIVDNYLMPENVTTNPSVVKVEGPGAVVWSAGSTGSYFPSGPLNDITINGGALILRSAFPSPDQLHNCTISNFATLTYDPVDPTDVQTLGGLITGTGRLVVNNGTLILGSGSTFVLNTYSGGTIISNGIVELTDSPASGSSPFGSGSIVNNGAIVYNRHNNISINSPISGTGSLSNINSGALTLAGSNTYGGSTTINAGTVAFQGVKTGTGDIFVGDVTTLGVTDTGTPITPGTLTLGTLLGCTLQFIMSGTNSAPIISANTLASAGPVTIYIQGSPPPLAVGHSYPLLSWTNGPAPMIVFGGMSFYQGNLSISGNTVWLNVTGVVQGTVYTWTGSVSGNTNLGLPQNWTTNGTSPATTLPSGATQDTARWDGVKTGNLVLAYATNSGNGFPNTGGFTFGIHLELTANQKNPVQIISVLAPSPNIGVFSISNNSASSPFILGDNTANNLIVVTRPGVQNIVHPFVNNSTAPCTISPSVRWLAGGGVGTTYDFSGPGDWVVNNFLMPDNSGGSNTIQVDGPGRVLWSAGRSGTYSPNSRLGSIVVNGGGLILKSAFTYNDGSIRFSNAPISVSTFLTYDPTNGTDAQTLAGFISGTGQLIVNGGTLTLGANNTYSGGTVVSNGVLQVGGGGATGTLGSGSVVNQGGIVFNRTGTLTLGAVSGTGSVTIDGGTLVVGAVGGTVNVEGGALAQSADGSIGTLTIGGGLNVGSGTVMAALNQSATPSNTLYQVAGTIGYTGGTLKLVNYGPTPANGARFKIFSQAVSGGNSAAIISPGFTVANNLATDGSVTVNGVQQAGSNKITPSISGGQLSLSWPPAWTGLHLQVQTDAPGQGLGTNWTTISGTDATNTYDAGPISSSGSVFYRLAP